MAIESVLPIASSALRAQSLRMTLIAENLANADSAASPDGGPYQRRIPVLQSAATGESGMGVRVAAVVRDHTEPRVLHDPSNPLADSNGDVKLPAINPVLEMVDMLQASRSYQASLSTLETARTVALRTIDLLK